MVAVPVPGPKVAITLALPPGSVFVDEEDSVTGPVANHTIVVLAGVPLSSAATWIVRLLPSSAVKLRGPTGLRLRITGTVAVTV